MKVGVRITYSAFEIDMEIATAARIAVNRLRPKGQRSIHFVLESDSRRKSILAAFAKIEFQVVMFVIKGKSEASARKICLEALTGSLNKRFRCSIIFYLNANRDQMDRLTFSSYSKKPCMKEKAGIPTR